MFKNRVKEKNSIEHDYNQRISNEYLLMHYRQLPAIIVAPALGAVFTAWVLWDAVNTQYLEIGLTVIFCISVFRVIVYKKYFSSANSKKDQRLWSRIAIFTALVSGCIWGSSAIFLYPPLDSHYQVYMLVLLALVPIAPVASLAIYMPSFYAYYIPCVTPFIYVLWNGQHRSEQTTAVLLLMMMGATITFANKYSNILYDAIRMRLKNEDKKQSLEQVAVNKTQFLATASHDLRQPVHALGLFVESLLQKTADFKNNDLIKNIADSTRNLRIMLDGMLDISRLDANLVVINRQKFRPANLITSLAREYSQQAKQKGLKFRCFSTDIAINSDPVLLERILRNFLSNAIKFTKEGKVLFGVRRHVDSIDILVYDTGPGIPVDQLDDIFIEYIQLDNRERGSKKGLGLGLSIIKRLADLLDHKIIARSGPDKGSVFGVNVPIAFGNVTELTDLTKVYSITSSFLKDYLVVVIDDDQSIRDAMAQLIRIWGGQSIVSENVENAVYQFIYLKKEPDLLILDYHLGNDKNAINAIQNINDVVNKRLPAIIITGDTSATLVREAHESGYLLLHKPVEPERLIACINSQLDQALTKPNF